MARFSGKRFTCAICGTQRIYTVLSGTKASGVPDLDTRPAGMARRDILHTVLCCKQCKYCAPNLSEYPQTAPDLVSSPEYRKLLSEKGIPELARRWACWSLLQERAGEHAAAGWAALRATWACDDAGMAVAAERYRAGAIESFHRGQKAGEPFAADRISEQLILTDLYRRNRRFERAIWLCLELQAIGAPAHIRNIVSFQLCRAEQEDSHAYTLDNVFEFLQAPEGWMPPSEEPPEQEWRQRLSRWLLSSLKIPIAPKQALSSGALSVLGDES